MKKLIIPNFTNDVTSVTISVGICNNFVTKKKVNIKKKKWFLYIYNFDKKEGFIENALLLGNLLPQKRTVFVDGQEYGVKKNIFTGQKG